MTEIPELLARVMGDAQRDVHGTPYAEVMRRQSDYVIAALAAAGWGIKPREPTEEMHAAGEAAIRDKRGNETGVVPIETEIAFDVWQAEFDAASGRPS